MTISAVPRAGGAGASPTNRIQSSGKLLVEKSSKTSSLFGSPEKAKPVSTPEGPVNAVDVATAKGKVTRKKVTLGGTLSAGGQTGSTAVDKQPRAPKESKSPKPTKFGSKKKRGGSGKKGKKSKRSKTPVPVRIPSASDPAAQENLYYISHDAQHALVCRGWPWPGRKKKKKKGKGKGKGKKRR